MFTRPPVHTGVTTLVGLDIPAYPGPPVAPQLEVQPSRPAAW